MRHEPPRAHGLAGTSRRETAGGTRR